MESSPLMQVEKCYEVQLACKWYMSLHFETATEVLNSHAHCQGGDV